MEALVTNIVPPSRTLVEDEPLPDSMLGMEGGITMHYTGSTREHPWASRKGERLMDGTGIAQLVDGNVYEGAVRLGMFHGMGVMRYENGDVYEGQWQTGLRHGYGVLECADGRSYVGTFADGEKDGLSEETSPNYSFSGVFRNGQPHGLGRIKLANGDQYDGVYHNGQLHGLCTISYAHGDVFVGTFVHGVVQGDGVYTQVDSGDTYTETFEDGRCICGVLDEGVEVVRGEGNFIPPTPNNNSSKQPTKQQNICVVKYHGTGDTYRGEWKRLADGVNRRGVRHGHGTATYAATGDVYEGEFENDLREGFGVLKIAHLQKSSEEDGSQPQQESEPTAPETRDGVLEEDGGAYPVLYEGAFHNDLCDGRGVLTLSDGTRVEGFWTRGARNGLSHSHPNIDKVRFRGEVQSSMFDMNEEAELDYHERNPDGKEVNWR